MVTFSGIYVLASGVPQVYTEIDRRRHCAIALTLADERGESGG